jgi:hypothetical protein
MWEEWRGVLCLFAFHYINWIEAPFAAILFALQAHLPAKMHSVHTHSGEDCVYFHLASSGSKLPNYYGAYRMAALASGADAPGPKFLSEKCKKYFLVLPAARSRWWCALHSKLDLRAGKFRAGIRRRKLAAARHERDALSCARTPTSTQIITQRLKVFLGAVQEIASWLNLTCDGGKNICGMPWIMPTLYISDIWWWEIESKTAFVHLMTSVANARIMWIGTLSRNQCRLI